MSSSEINKLREHFAIEHKADSPNRYSGFGIACLVNEMPSSRARMQEYIEAEDHDRIVAELRAEVERLSNGGFVPHTNSPETKQAIDKLVDDLENVGSLRETIARQAKVISDVKSFLDNHATRPNEVLIQIREAIEQGEGM